MWILHSRNTCKELPIFGHIFWVVSMQYCGYSCSYYGVNHKKQFSFHILLSYTINGWCCLLYCCYWLLQWRNRLTVSSFSFVSKKLSFVMFSMKKYPSWSNSWKSRAPVSSQWHQMQTRILFHNRFRFFFGTDNRHLSLITIRKILLTLFSFRSQSDFLRSQNRRGYDDGIIFSSRLIRGFMFLQVSCSISSCSSCFLSWT